MANVKLTDRKIQSLKPAPAGQRYQVMDAHVPGFGVRVTDTGQRTFILRIRYPGSPDAARRALGEYPSLTLEKAREKAGKWRTLVKQGIDPVVAEERDRQVELKKQATLFSAVAEAFIAEKLPSERKAREVERDIRRDLIPAWGKLPVTEIDDLRVIARVKEKKRTAPAQARNLLALTKRMFSWAVDQRIYGLTASPAATLKPTSLIGEKASGVRTLSDDELAALWRVAKRTPYPHGPVYHLLILTALRLNEAADAHWSEIDLSKRLWTIPAARMKGRNSKARPHAVPLTDEITALLAKVHRFKTGDYLFSTTFGVSPVWMSDKVKKRIDERMLRTLRAVARQRGEDPSKVVLPAWTNHDIRRTVRSNLSRLKISEEAREALLAHARPGIKGTYDLYDYLDEKREALELWGARLRAIVNPPNPTSRNVVAFPGRA